MAGYIIHRLIGDDAAAALPAGNSWLEFIRQHRVAFIWGTQGPDTLFHDMPFLSLGRKRGPTNSYGGYMHRNNTPALFEQLSRYLIENKNSPDYPALVAFACGFICHYCVDRHIHACVYNRMRVYNGVVKTFKPHDVHMKLETDMDSAFYRLRTGKDVRSFEIEKEMLSNRQDIHAVGLFFSALIQRVCGDSVAPETIEKDLEFFYHKEKFLFDKSGILSRLFCRLKEIIYGEKISYTLYCRPADADYDVLNMSHAPWVHPLFPDEISYASIPELLEQSVKDAAAMIIEIQSCVEESRPYLRDQMDSFDCGSDASPKPY